LQALKKTFRGFDKLCEFSVIVPFDPDDSLPNTDMEATPVIKVTAIKQYVRNCFMLQKYIN
jgi:hypothetical protein